MRKATYRIIKGNKGPSVLIALVLYSLAVTALIIYLVQDSPHSLLPADISFNMSEDEFSHTLITNCRDGWCYNPDTGNVIGKDPFAASILSNNS